MYVVVVLEVATHWEKVDRELHSKVPGVQGVGWAVAVAEAEAEEEVLVLVLEG